MGNVKKVFEVTHDGHHIRVENSWFGGEKLYVDGKLQDENIGIAIRATLNGQIKNANGESKKIKVAIGGGANLKISCKIFVDNQLVFPK